MSKKTLKNVSKNAGRAWESGENVDTAFASRTPKAALSSLPEVLNFYQKGKGLNLFNSKLSFFQFQCLYQSAPLENNDSE